MPYKFDKNTEMARKVTRADIEDLKKHGIDHWMFDEMEFEEDKIIQSDE
mgnify:CR=1 FL=1